jgi:hypothetical protein
MASAHAGSRFLDLLQKSGVILELEVKPVILRREAGQDTCGLTVFCDDDLFFTGLDQILGEVVSKFRECHLFHVRSPSSASHSAAWGLSTIA